MTDAELQALRDEVKGEVKAELDAQYRVEMDQWIAKQDADNKEIVNRAITEIAEEYKPVQAADIQKVLEQEYVTFTVKLVVGGAAREFVIGELPQAKELRFYRKLKELLVSKGKEFASLLTGMLDGKVEERLQAIANLLDPSMELLADMAAVAINDSTITREWVQENLASYRIWNIVWAQVEVNKIRDFFSRVSLSSSTGTIRGVGYQRSQQ